MKKILLGLLGVLLISLFSYICFILNGDSIKQNLTAKVNNTLNSNSYTWANASLVGQSIESTNIVKLTGIAPSDEEKMNAQMLVSKIDGVGGVENQIVVDKKQPTEDNTQKLQEGKKELTQNEEKNSTAVKEVAQEQTQNPKEEIEKNKDLAKNEAYHIYMVKNAKNKIFLEGFVPSKELHETLVKKAGDLFDKENVVDNLKVVPDAPKDWNYMSEFGLEKLAEVDFGDMNITESSYVFKAHLSSHDKKIEFLNGIKKVMSDPANHYGRYRGDYIVTAPLQTQKNIKVAVEDKKVENNNTNISKDNKDIDKKEEVSNKPTKTMTCQELLDRTLGSKKIHFQFNSYRIDKNSYTLLDDIVHTISDCHLGDKIIEIGGHTDSRGRSSYNKWLSQKRAENVKNYLVKKGISSHLLKAVGYGEEHPIADNKTEQGRAQNRRIEFKIKGE